MNAIFSAQLLTFALWLATLSYERVQRFFKETISDANFDTMQMDPLPYTEDYFAVYNGAVILAANPYFNFARQLGLRSVATGGYVSEGELTGTHARMRSST